MATSTAEASKYRTLVPGLKNLSTPRPAETVIQTTAKICVIGHVGPYLMYNLCLAMITTLVCVSVHMSPPPLSSTASVSIEDTFSLRYLPYPSKPPPPAKHPRRPKLHALYRQAHLTSHTGPPRLPKAPQRLPHHMRGSGREGTADFHCSYGASEYSQLGPDGVGTACRVDDGLRREGA